MYSKMIGTMLLVHPMILIYIIHIIFLYVIREYCRGSNKRWPYWWAKMVNWYTKAVQNDNERKRTSYQLPQSLQNSHRVPCNFVHHYHT
jgi:hypothetical protein